MEGVNEDEVRPSNPPTRSVVVYSPFRIINSRTAARATLLC